MRARIAILIASGCVLVGGPPAQASSLCANADVDPVAAPAPVVQDATLCLLNEERSAQGLPPLAASNPLAGSASGYADRMVRQRFFDHVAPDGSEVIDRVAAAGYVTQGDSWLVGENIGWAVGAMASPRSMVAAWMGSPGHRANVLDRRYVDAGVGLAVGTPTGASNGVTYAAHFGLRNVLSAEKPTPSPRASKRRKSAAKRAKRAQLHNRPADRA